METEHREQLLLQQQQLQQGQQQQQPFHSRPQPEQSLGLPLTVPLNKSFSTSTTTTTTTNAAPASSSSYTTLPETTTTSTTTLTPVTPHTATAVPTPTAVGASSPAPLSPPLSPIAGLAAAAAAAAAPSPPPSSSASQLTWPLPLALAVAPFSMAWSSLTSSPTSSSHSDESDDDTAGDDNDDDDDDDNDGGDAHDDKDQSPQARRRRGSSVASSTVTAADGDGDESINRGSKNDRSVDGATPRTPIPKYSALLDHSDPAWRNHPDRLARAFAKTTLQIRVGPPAAPSPPSPPLAAGKHHLHHHHQRHPRNLHHQHHPYRHPAAAPSNGRRSPTRVSSRLSPSLPAVAGAATSSRPGATSLPRPGAASTEEQLLADAYFRVCCTPLQVVHRLTLMAGGGSGAGSGGTVPASCGSGGLAGVHPFLRSAICAMGASAPTMMMLPKTVMLWYYDFACSHVAAVKQGSHQSVESLQALLILGYVSLLIGRIAEGRRQLKVACKMAYLLQLNVDPDCLGREMSAVEKETRRRCWWTCHLSAQFLSLSLHPSNPLPMSALSHSVKPACRDDLWLSLDHSVIPSLVPHGSYLHAFSNLLCIVTDIVKRVSSGDAADHEACDSPDSDFSIMSVLDDGNSDDESADEDMDCEDGDEESCADGTGAGDLLARLDAWRKSLAPGLWLYSSARATVDEQGSPAEAESNEDSHPSARRWRVDIALAHDVSLLFLTYSGLRRWLDVSLSPSPLAAETAAAAVARAGPGVAAAARIASVAASGALGGGIGGSGSSCSMFAQLPLLASAEFLAVFSAAAIAAANLANHDVVSTVSPASGGSTASSAAGFSSLSQAARGWLQSAVGSMQALGGARPGLGAAGSLFERLSSSKFCALDALGAAAPAGPESTRTMQEESRRMWLEEAIDVSAWVSSPVVAAIRAAATTASAAAFPVSRALTDDDRRQAARFSREPKPSSMVWEREFVCQR